MNSFGYNVCFLDILGFSEKISQEGGLEKIKTKYIQLTDAVRAINDRYREIISKGILEGSYWSDSGIGLFYKTNVLYGSDSIIIWSDRTWDRFKSVADPSNVHPFSRWETFPKACDPFLEVCNEIICKSIELDLPLRGAISTGDGYFDLEKYIFIGKPIIEAVKLEKLQNIIGASFCLSFENQIIPKRFYSKMDNYLKMKSEGKDVNPDLYTNQNILDWPRHWRNTRKSNLHNTIDLLDFGERVDIKENTLRSVEKSLSNSQKFLSPEDSSIAIVYREIYDNCGLPIRLMWKDDHWDFGDFKSLNSFVVR